MQRESLVEPGRRFTRSTDDTAGTVAAAPAPGGEMERRDLVRWGPIVAGLVTVIATLAILSTLGLAIGLSAVEPSGTGFAEISTGAWIWGIGSGAIAFFLGGLLASATAAVGGRGRGALNGLMVGAASIAATLLLLGAGAGTVLGAGASALGDVANIGNQLNIGEASDAAADAFARAEGSAWGTFIGLTLAVALAALGGLVGARDRADRDPLRR